MNTQVLSEQEQLKERLAGIANSVLNWAFNNPFWAVMIVLFVIALLVFLAVKGVVKTIGPIEFPPHSEKPNKYSRGKADRLITDLPAPMPNNKDAQLPPKLRRVLRELKEGTRKRIAIVCDEHSHAEELGKLLYHKINEKKIGNHIGWLTYKKFEKRPLTISTCINAEFSIYRDVKDYELRSSLCKKFLRSNKYHTILFVNIIDYPEQKDTTLEQCNNLPGLSIILLSSVEMTGFEKCYFENIEEVTWENV